MRYDFSHAAALRTWHRHSEPKGQHELSFSRVSPHTSPLSYPVLPHHYYSIDSILQRVTVCYGSITASCAAVTILPSNAVRSIYKPTPYGTTQCPGACVPSFQLLRHHRLLRGTLSFCSNSTGFAGFCFEVNTYLQFCRWAPHGVPTAGCTYPPVFEVGTPWGPHIAIIQLGTLCDHGMVQADRGKLKSDLEVRDQGVVRGPQHQIMLGTPSDFFRARTYTISQCCVYLNPWHHKHPLV